MASELDEHVFALASANHLRYHEARQPTNYNKDRSHLKLLDYIALLLVTDGKSDVAAVTMRQLPNAVTFYYSKNAPCSAKFGEYLQRLTTICASVEGDSFNKDFLTEVLATCGPKVTKRLDKCQKAIKKIENIEFDVKIAAEVPKAAKQKRDWAGKTFGEITEDFLDRLGSYDMKPHKGGSISASSGLCVEAFFIGREPGLQRYPTLAGRIKKFGDYYGAARHIRALLKDPKLTHLRGKISMLEIRPPQPRVVQVTRNVVQILNDHAKKTRFEEMNAADFVDSFQEPVHENGKPHMITVSSHCELTLALHFYETMTRSKNFIEMGVSKGCCWLCQHFLDSLSRQKKQVVVKVSHNQVKIHAGWGMPDKTPRSVAEKMLQIIDHELCDIHRTVEARRDSVSSEPEFEINRILATLDD